jgi:hypothetical protein
MLQLVRTALGRDDLYLLFVEPSDECTRQHDSHPLVELHRSAIEWMDMNKWLYRAVGVASGALLLGGGVAHAGMANEANNADPQAMRGLLAGLFTPTGGQHHLGLQLDIPVTRAATGIFATGQDSAQPASNRIGFSVEESSRAELLPGLGLTGGAAGNGGLLGGLTGSAGGGSGLVSGLTGGLTGGGGSGLLGGITGGGGLTGGLTGGGADAKGLLGGLTGGGLLGGAGDGGPLGGLTGGLSGDGGPLGSLTGGLSGTPLGGLTGGALGQDGFAQDGFGQDGFAQDDLSQWTATGPLNTDIIDPALRGTGMGALADDPLVLDPALARQVNDATQPMVSALLADAMAQRFADLGTPVESFDEEAIPIVGGLPLVGDMLGSKGPLSQFLVVGQMFDNLPVVGDLTRGGDVNLSTLDRLPVVSKVLNQGLIQSDGPSLPLVGGLPFVGKLTGPLSGGGGNDPLGGLTGSLTSSLTGGLSGGKGPLGGLTGGLSDGGPLGSLTNGGPLGSLTGGLADGGPLGGLTGGLTGPAPVAAPAAAPTAAKSNAAKPSPAKPTAAKPAPAGQIKPTRDVPRQDYSGPVAAEAPKAGKHRAPSDTTRPTVVDPEYRFEENLPLLGQLTGDSAAAGSLPVSTLVRQLPLASELPLVGQLGMLRSMPVVGMVFGVLPIESDTAA